MSGYERFPNTMETAANLADQTFDKLVEYLIWKSVPEKVKHVIDDLIYFHMIAEQNPDKFDDYLVKSLAEKGEHITCHDRYLEEVRSCEHEFQKAGLWIDLELDQVKKSAMACLDNCPIMRRLSTTGPGLAEQN